LSYRVRCISKSLVICASSSLSFCNIMTFSRILSCFSYYLFIIYFRLWIEFSIWTNQCWFSCQWFVTLTLCWSLWCWSWLRLSTSASLTKLCSFSLKCRELWALLCRRLLLLLLWPSLCWITSNKCWQITTSSSSVDLYES